MGPPELIVCEDSDKLAAEAAGLVIRCAREAVEERGRFTLVLTGGRAPEKMYTLLAETAGSESILWQKTYIFVADERFVPPDDPRSNFGLARRTLLAGVPVPALQVFPVPTGEPTAAAAAARYAAELARFFPADFRDTRPPRFDLILLGMGEDGHTASLFPGAAALEVEDAWVTWSPPGVLPPAVDRITMTYPVLNAARHVAFLVAGEKKAVALYDVLEGRADRNRRPAAGIQPRAGTLTWFVDQAAATLLSRKT
jgi:6-phosphogluconolactonase